MTSSIGVGSTMYSIAGSLTTSSCHVETASTSTSYRARCFDGALDFYRALVVRNRGRLVDRGLFDGRPIEQVCTPGNWLWLRLCLRFRLWRRPRRADDGLVFAISSRPLFLCDRWFSDISHYSFDTGRLVVRRGMTSLFSRARQVLLDLVGEHLRVAPVDRGSLGLRTPAQREAEPLGFLRRLTQDRNAERLNVRTRGTEVAQVLVEHAVIEGRHERRRQDQIGDAILERQESLADFSRLYRSTERRPCISAASWAAS